MSKFNNLINVVVPEVLASLTTENDIFEVSFEAVSIIKKRIK